MHCLRESGVAAQCAQAGDGGAGAEVEGDDDDASAGCSAMVSEGTWYHALGNNDLVSGVL
jgi:hypothetical protein